MDRFFKLCRGCVVLAAVLMVGLTTLAFAEDNAIELVVSPNVLNLESKGGVVTLHADIAYDSDYDLELEVNGQSLTIASTSADSRGDLVIKCSLVEVKGMLEVGEASFDLTVNDYYTGTDTILVIDECGCK